MEASGCSIDPRDGVDDEAPAAASVGRRQVLVAASSLALLGGVLATRSSLADNPARLPSPNASRRFGFFSPAEAAFMDAAVDRLIPSDALGPGAVEAGVPVFIDHQLQGPYGSAADWYMQGPWADGTPQQGYQRRRTPAQVYRAAIAAIDDHARRSSNKTFSALDSAERDGLLHGLEDGTLDLGDVSAKT
ncbi:MAG: gluconate 2-dehydrogenase subunit 3 family protein, partial [Pseudomonadota bacterium]|nr:gluconate 2-dehydrogenase subunit 3 family protein [Pseudomonadota bacterium]